MRRIISLILVAVILLGVMPQNVFATNAADSMAVTEESSPGKIISILGDSISTFKGYIPEGNATYYPANTVQNAADTWWMQLITELGANLGVNESWSGSYVSETAANKLAMASVERIQNLGSNGTPEVILFFGGTNDIAYKRPLGSFDPATAPEQADLTATAWDSLADGYVAAILRMQHYYPDAQIVSILPTINRSYYNNATLEQHNAVLRAICTHYGVEYVDLVAAGFTASMLGDATHPNAVGMDFITAAVKEKLQAEHSHVYTAVVTEPTCAAQGYTTHTCDCGDSYVDSYVGATGKHDYHRGHCAVCGNETALQGKTFSILGDSISTYTNISNNTQSNATIGNNRVYYTAGKLGVYQADTWWQQAIDQFGLELLVNNSWSGSQVWGTGAQAQPAYIDRCVQLHNIEGKTPDIIAVYLGTNDFTVSKSKLGTADEIDYDTLISHNGSEFVYAAPATVCESYAIMLHKISQRYPDAEVYCFTLLPRINQSVDHVQLAEGLNESIAQIAREFGAIVVDLYHDSGIRADSYFKTFVADNSLHPGPAGMDAITGCFTSAVLKNSNYFGGTAYDVSYDLNNVTVSEGTANAVEGDKSFSCSLIVPAGYESVVTVTMGGADITASCYHDGKIMVDRVTGDMVITAEAKLPEVAPSDYRWEYDGADLVAADGSNALTRLAGSIKNGVHTAGQYQLQKKIYLLHHRPWAIEWKSTGTWAGRTNGSGVLLFAEGKASNTSNGAYLYRRPGTDFIGLGYYDGTYRNYGVVLSGRGIDLSEEHTYLMENRIAADGTNMVWLLIDGVEMGPMNQYYEGGTNKNTTSDWVAGKDFSFSYMGTSAHPLGDCSIDYVQIWENGRPAHTHSYEATVTDPTCTEQGYTTYTCDCGDSYVDDYVDATGEHSYENGICTGCGADEPETPKDCSEGHQFGDWSEDTFAACRKHYVRECLVCGESQQAKVISEQTIPFAVPAITANVGDLVNLSLYSVAFTAASVIPAAELTWTGEAVENGCVIPDASGVYALTASAGESSKTVYLVVKNPADTEYVLYFDDFDNAQLDGYRAIEVPSGAKYSVSDGNLILDAGTNSNNHMRILLPEWIGAFGDYEITTRFSMLSAVQSSYWFATMARVQNEDYPYWQAAIRQNASASNGVEISTRTKASGASGGWTVTHKTALDENLSASKYYTQTFGLSGTNGFHAINDTILLESDAITNMVGDVGFHLRASKVAVDSIKIVIPSDDSDHNFDTWTVTREASCTEAGEESRTCSQCGATEYREIEAGHSLTKYAHKLPTCTEPGWKAYESCSRCDYTTYVEFPAVGHTFERDIHSVAHRGYSDVAPENTLIAYTMAKELGFRYVECDISLTADRRAVLLHDDTINRTSNGTGKITSLTYEQLLQYDFGSWKGEEFAGTKIPTLEEFLGLCMELELHPYIELKTSGYTKAEIASLVQLVEECGLLDNCTWISFNATYLGYVKAADPTARLGYLRNDDATKAIINTAKSLRTISNEVFLDLAYSKLTETGLLLAKENGFEVEVWTVDDEDVVKSMPASIIGFTSNMLAAEEILKNAQVTLPTCTEQGYTTYTCTCGESYVDDYVDATGEHRYENGVCVDCGAAQPQPIIITRQPVPAAAVIGEKATVFVEAAGEGLSYQWYYRDDCNADFTRSTVRGNTYTLTVKAANAARELYCVITDAQGNQVTTDTVKMLQPLAEELKIITQPASAYALIGEKATVTMEVQGIGLTYQWYYRDLPGGSLTKSTITTADYSITVKPTYVNRELYCVITDAHGNQVTTDTVKMLEPLRESLEITKQPVSSTAAIGETAAVSVEAKGEGLTYQWYFRNTPSGALSKSSITGNSYSVIVSKSNAQRVVYCVITDGHGNKVTTETVALRTDAPAEEPKIYFASLSDALAGIDGSAAPEGAVVRVDKDSDETVITLLGDTSLTESLTVTEDVVLDLNGFTVSSEIFPMIHVKSGICSLQNGSILLTSDGSGTTSAPAVAITVDPGAGLHASKATVTVTDSANGTVIGIATAAGSTLVLTETDVTVTTGKSLDNAGIHTKGTAVLTDCSVIAEADYTGANGAYTSSAKGILAEDDLELYNCYVWGPHSGVNTKGNLYVDGGTYEGYGHGGIYISGTGSTNYIYNATIRWATMRAGTVADSVAGTNHSAMYIGYANDITTYFDGCTFSANRSSKKSYCIVLRDSAGESNNCVYVSNSSFKNYNKYAYRSNNVPAERRLFAYSGVGNTYATDKVFQYARNGFYTNESYDQWRK